MSNWPEAVWVVKKLEKYFNFDDDINNYRNQLNGIIPQINELNSKAEALSSSLEEKESYLDTLASSFISTKNSSSTPSDITIEPTKGTIWFISK